MFENQKITLKSNQSLVLSQHDRFWMVTSGELDVFYVNIDSEGKYTSALKYLYSVAAGELLFSLITSEATQKNTKLLAVSKGASLVAITKNKLLDINHLFLKSMIDKWVLKTANSIQLIQPPRLYTSLTSCKTLQLEKGTITYPNKGVLWVKIIKGSVSKYASDKLSSISKFNYPFAVSTNLWIKIADENVDIKALSTKDALKEEIDFMLALHDLQDHLYAQLIKNTYQELNEERQRLEEKITSETSGLTKALSQLSHIITDNSPLGINDGDDIKTVTNYLFKTCQVIGRATGFTFESPKHIESYNSSITKQLYTIAQASNIRLRKVILRGQWWKEDNGHLLAFYKDSNKPVALIQSTPNSYTLNDVFTGTKRKLTEDIVDQLIPIGYMFFYGFDTNMTSLKNITKFAAKGIKKDFKYLIFAAFTGSLIGLLVPVLSGVMFDDVIPSADKSLHTEVFIIMLMLGVVTAGLQLVQGVLQLRVETKSNINMQAGVMDHLLRLPVTFYRRFSAGDLTNRALSINAIRQLLSSTVMTAALSGAFSFVNLILLFYYQSDLAWIGVGLALIAIGFMVIIGFMKLKYDRQISDIQGDLQGFLFEFLSGISKIRVTGGEKRIFSLWANKFSTLKQLGFNSGSFQNYVETFNSSYPLLTNMFFFGFIYYTVSNAKTAGTMISVGAFMAFISAFNQFLRDCLKMSIAFITSLNLVTLYERVKPILEETPESSEQSTAPGELVGDIELNSISFRYNETQPLVLKDVSFKVKPGEMVAFVGTSGSGKSTIMRLLLGFEKPETGSIYYDGKGFDGMSKDLVRQQIGTVLQNGTLMSGSIYQNIVGNSQLTIDDAWEAARMAGIEEDIKQMPMQMHTVVSEGAGTFSGGQRQRLMIARAIVHKPRLLFMDEATSALDNKTQHIVSESLTKLKATRIVIAHRLSTVKNADRIYVLDKGQIVESGSYQELIQKEGVFTGLAKRQMA